jgi:hypothetical protein
MDYMTVSEAYITRLYRAFFGPAKYETKPSDQEVLDRGDTYRLPFAGGTLAVTTWGNSGQTVLLIHGWGGSRAQMSRIYSTMIGSAFPIGGTIRWGVGNSQDGFIPSPEVSQGESF